MVDLLIHILKLISPSLFIANLRALPFTATGIICRSPVLDMAVLEKRPAWRGVLVAREKTIQCLECLNPPFTMPQELQLEGAFKEAFIFNSCGMGHFVLRPLGTTANLVHKWIEFNTYLRNQAKVGVVLLQDWELFILPPKSIPVADLSAEVYYRARAKLKSPACVSQTQGD